MNKKLLFTFCLALFACVSVNAKLFVNEVNPIGKWIEIYNDGNSQVNVGGYFVSRNNNDGATSAAVIPFGTIIAANGYLVLYQRGEAPAPTPDAIDCLPYGISADKLMNVILKDNTGVVIDNFNIGDPQTVTVSGGRSWARETDGSAKIVESDPTPGKSNTTIMPPSEFKVFVNEVNSTGKWIEFYNDENVTVDLSGFNVIRTNNDGTNNFYLPAKTTIAAKGFLVIFQGPKSGGTSPSPVNGALDCMPFGISTDRFLSVVLVDTKGLYTDKTFNIGDPQTVTVTGGKSWARETDGAKNIVALDPTPGNPNSNELTPSEYKIFVNEVNSTGKWIEFFNGSDKEVNMGEFTITRSNYDGTSVASIPSSAKIAPKGFLVIYEGTASGGTSPSPVEGAIDCMTFGISTDRFMNVVLRDNKGLIADNTFDIGYPQTVTVSSGKSWARETDGAKKILALEPTPGKSNSTQLPHSDLKIFINEVNSTGKWIEIYNSEDKVVNVGGFTVIRNNNDGGMSVAPIPAGKTIAPKGFLVLYQGTASGGTSPSPVDGAIDCLTYGISSDRFMSAVLKDNNGLLVDESFDIDNPQKVQVTGSESWARKTDGSSEIVAQKATPGLPNNTYTNLNPVEIERENIFASIHGGVLWLPEKTTSVKMYGISGNLVLDKEITDTSIDLSGLQKGFYVVRMVVSGKVYGRKVVW